MNKKLNRITAAIGGTRLKNLFIWMWITLAGYVSLPVFFAIGVPESATAFVILPGAFSGLAFFIITIIYCSKRHQIKKCLKTLATTGNLKYIAEIIQGEYNSNGKQGFSAHLMYDKKTDVIVAYDDMVWIYKKIKDGKPYFMFCTPDGKKYLSLIDELSLAEFLKRLNREILLGFTPENKAMYAAITSSFKNKIQ